MSKDNNSIHEFDMELIKDYFIKLDRQGPGSVEVTLKALGFIDKLDDNSKIIDIGCGTGGQTLTLAKHAPGNITGMDVFPGFIDKLNHNAAELQLDHKVKGILASMFDLPFQENELDLIWCEGAIYFIGFEKGLREWGKYLKSGAYIAVSEACWFTEERPQEIHDFWMQEYPGIDTIPNKLAQLQSAGYVPMASFILPEKCWTEEYHIPQQAIQEEYLKEHAGNPAAEAFVGYQKEEAQLYSRYKDYYGYAFFIGKKL